MKGFEVFDLSGDLGLRIFGESLDDLFVSAALGFYSSVTDPGKILVKTEIGVSLEEESLEALLVAWLNELIYLLDAEGFLCKYVDVKSVSQRHLVADLHGEPFDAVRHECGLLVKAATYHGLSVLYDGGTWKATVILDL
ncbi:MAG: archease [Nitrospirae bacterium]|nr:archease [Nitrospirota bacterium]